MKFALVSPLEPRFDGFRIAEVVDQRFEVASPLFWIEVSDEVTPQTHYCLNATIILNPVPQRTIAVIQGELNVLERRTLMNRTVREDILDRYTKRAMTEYGVDEATAIAELYVRNIAYRRIKDIDNQAAGLRAEIKALEG